MQTAKFSTSHYIFFIAIAAGLLFILFLGRVHLFDWDEINFAECAREMIVTGDYTRVYMDFKPFWEKPPLFFWMQAFSMHIFGINEFAARFPNAVCGVITLVVLFLTGKKIYSERFGIIWALAYAGSLFPGMYFKSGIIDPWFNLFIFLSLYFFILYNWKRNDFEKEKIKSNLSTYAIWSGIFMGLAILTKGPASLIIFLLVLAVYFVLNQFRFFFSWIHVLLFFISLSAVVFSWYGYEYFKNGSEFINQFLKYQYELFTKPVAGQGGFPGYHFIVILFGCFPASVFAIPSFFKNQHDDKLNKDFKKWMLIIFWVVMILFSVVKSRIAHYSSLAWFPVTFLAAYTFYNWQSGKLILKKYVPIVAAFVGSIIALLLIAFPIFAINIKKITPYVKDKFAIANMKADVHWSGLESLIGVLLIAIIITGLIYLNKKQFTKAAWILFAGTAIVIFLASAIMVPKIERYSQGAAIDFLIEKRGEDCYIHALGYKTYAPPFYARKEKPSNENSYDESWLLTGDIDKPVYFLSRIDRYDNFKKYDLTELYRKNGFIFLKREIP